jgi:2OG-Fe(II) oxygenase superfamily
MTNPSIHVTYQLGFKSLEQLLAKVQRPGDFVAHGIAEVPMPKLEVDGVGTISFPVLDRQVREIIQQSELAPYGLGEQTLTDTSVRKVWQLPPNTVRLGSKSWMASLRHIIDQAAVRLGCEPAAVSAEFYKMLVYDQGSFFATHRDTEKSDGMFGTLVIVLPSAHRGGELVIRHAGREVTVDVSMAETSELAFIAFYADCQHEVRPLIEGNRVCLIYNLVQVRGEKSGRSSLTAPLYDAEVVTAAKLITEAMSRPQVPAKIVWLLEHQYSPDGLSFSGLKNADAAQAKVLLQAATLARCVVHLGIVHIEESGSAESTYDHYGYQGRSRRWNHDEDDKDDGEDDATDRDFEIVDVCDSSRYVDHWVDTQDRRVAFGRIPLGEDELLPQGALDEEAPDKQRLTEATGNEGASFERSYHRAALVLWPQARFAEVLLPAGIEAVMPYLQDQIQACMSSAAPPTARTEVTALATRVLDAWENQPESRFYGQPNAGPCRINMLDALGQFGDATLLRRFVGGVMTQNYNGTENAELIAHTRLLTSESAGALFAKLVKAHMTWTPGSCVDLLLRLVRHNLPKKEWSAACVSLASAIVDGLAAVEGNGERESDRLHWRHRAAALPLTAALMADLFHALGSLDLDVVCEKAVTHIVARPAVFVPDTIIVPALTLLRPRHENDPANDHAFLKLWTHAGEFFLERSQHPPESPKNWRQEVKLGCRCEDCRALEAFARDAEAQVGRFRLRQDRRQHLQDTSARHDLDMTHVTERKGSPQTLICTKTRRTYQRQCERYRADISSLSELAKMPPRSSDARTALTLRMTAALRRAEKWAASEGWPSLDVSLFLLPPHQVDTRS